MKKLFIDDYRKPHQASPALETILGWDIALDYDAAMVYIIAYKPQRIAFDHDLAPEHYSGIFDGVHKTGHDIAKARIQLDMDNPDAGYITKDFKFTSHSMNPDGRRNILLTLQGYYRHKFHGG